MSSELKEGQDYYIEDGNYVFLEKFHLDRGVCCESKCRHCPFESWGKRSKQFFTLPIESYKEKLGKTPKAFSDYDSYLKGSKE